MGANNQSLRGTSQKDYLTHNLGKIRDFSYNFYDPTDDLHGLAHIQRVITHAKLLWEKEGGNWDLIEAIIWLHDIGRRNELIEKRNHAVLSKEYAEQFLRGFDWNAEYIPL